MTEAVTRIREYLEHHKLSANAFALEHKLDPSEFSKLLRGKRSRISLETAAKIELATAGYVKIKMWLRKELDEK